MRSGFDSRIPLQFAILKKVKKILVITVVLAILVANGLVWLLSSKQRSNNNDDSSNAVLRVDPTAVCVGKNGYEISHTEAFQIAQQTSCNIEAGKQISFTDQVFCNEVTGTFWIDVTTSPAVQGCSPACVVTLKDKTAAVNWRCTGALQ